MPFPSQRISRRDLLKAGVLVSAAATIPPWRVASAKAGSRLPASQFPEPFTIDFAVPPVAAPQLVTPDRDYYEIRMRQATVEIIPGRGTTVWGYNGKVPGPTIVARRGRGSTVRFINELPALSPFNSESTTSVHLHGGASLPQYDGYADDKTRSGMGKDYEYENIDRARTLWYHDHSAHHTAENAYLGLAGMYVLHDDRERGLPIPQGAYDIPFILRDALFDEQAQLLFDDNGHSNLNGDVILVNGVPWPRMAVERRKYRFRILNASLSRAYELTLSTGEPLTVIGTDAGLMPAPARVPSFRIGAGERYEVVIDFSKYQPGQRVILKNLGTKNSVDYPTTAYLCAFDVQAGFGDPTNNEIPAVLDPTAEVMSLSPNDATAVRTFVFARHNGLWTVNKETWEDVIQSNYERTLAETRLGDVEIWEFVNKAGGWYHPVHVHMLDVRILSRNGAGAFAYERGPKDVIFLGPNESVRVITRIGPHEGKYMIHCHHLAHEDHDMMHQFRVGPRSTINDPIYAAPAQNIGQLRALGE